MNTGDSMIYPQHNMRLWVQMNPFSNSSLPVVLDPVAAAIIAQLQQRVETKDQVISEKDAQLARSQQALAAADSVIQQLKDALRMERIRKYGKRSETLSDLQLQLLDLEPAVSSDEIEAESQRDPISEAPQKEQSGSSTAQEQKKKRKPHPGRNKLPAHLQRVEEVIACTPAQCACGRCGGETIVIGYEQTEVLGKKPAEYYVRVIKREKRACAACVLQGVETAATPVRIAPKSIFSDEVIIDFIMAKYADATPLYRQRAILLRDLGIDVPLTTINDAVLRVGELLIPVVDVMKRDLLTGGYIQADETYVGVQTPEKKGANHRAYFWQYSSPGKGVVFDFEMTRSGEVPKKFFKDYSGILHSDGYAGYGEKVGADGIIHACCLAHSRRKFIEAVKVNAKDLDSARVVVLMDALFATDREAREQNLSIAERHALRQERAPALLDELHALVMKMNCRVLPKSAAGKAVFYTLARWEKLTRFMEHPVIELSTNWAENSMRPIVIGRKNWLHIGSKEAGPKIAAIFSVIESCRKLNIPTRKYLADLLPGLAERSIRALADLTPTAYVANRAK
jgi:transposase